MVSWSLRRSTRTLAGFTAVLVLGGVALSAPSGARMMRVPIDGTGTVSCSLAGKLSFSPPLSALGNPVATTVTLRAVLTNCSGTGDGANVVRGIVNVSGQSPTNDCLTLLTNAQSAARSGPLRWVTARGTPRLNPSTIELDTAAFSAGPPITVDTGGSATAGSFAGDTSASHTVVMETFDRLRSLCLGRGLRAIHFLPGSTFALTAPASAS